MVISAQTFHFDGRYVTHWNLQGKKQNMLTSAHQNRFLIRRRNGSAVGHVRDFKGYTQVLELVNVY